MVASLTLDWKGFLSLLQRKSRHLCQRCAGSPLCVLISKPLVVGMPVFCVIVESSSGGRVLQGSLDPVKVTVWASLLEVLLQV